MCDRSPGPEPFGLVIVPVAARALDARRLPRVRPPRRQRARRTSSTAREAAALAGELPPPVNDLQDAARSLCPAIDDALAAVAAPGAEHAWSPAPGPTVFGLYDDLEAARAAARGRRRRRSRPSPVAAATGRCGGVKWGWLLGAVALAAFLFVRRRRLGRSTLGGGLWSRRPRAVLVGIGVIHLPNLEKLILDVGDGARAVDVPARRRARVPGDRRVRRARRAGRDGGDRRRPRRRPGRRSPVVLIAIVWACAVAGDLTSYTLGPQARARAGCCATASG